VKVVFLVPRRSDGGRRDELWEWVRARWAVQHPGIDVVVGEHDDGGPFNRSAAVNAAAREAGDWDLAVIADSDAFVTTAQLDEALGRAARTGRFTIAYESVVGLNAEMSDAVMAGFDGDWLTGVDVRLEGACSLMIVVPRPLWDRVGGFDEGFVGWGAEDVAFWRVCDTFGGGTERLRGIAWHLWHPRATDAAGGRWERLERYAAAADDHAAMDALLDELGVRRQGG
jgi:hypothetical protein